MTTSAVTLEELKRHLRVDDDYEDALITSYGIAATELAEQILNREIVSGTDTLAVCSTVTNVPAAIKTWILLYADDLFARRGLIDSGDSKLRTYDHLLDRWILYSREDSE